MPDFLLQLFGHRIFLQLGWGSNPHPRRGSKSASKSGPMGSISASGFGQGGSIVTSRFQPGGPILRSPNLLGHRCQSCWILDNFFNAVRVSKQANRRRCSLNGVEICHVSMSFRSSVHFKKVNLPPGASKKCPLPLTRGVHLQEVKMEKSLTSQCSTCISAACCRKVYCSLLSHKLQNNELTFT